MNIIDLRQTTVRQLEPLLLEEARHWRDELHWDYRSALDLIKRFLMLTRFPVAWRLKAATRSATRLRAGGLQRFNRRALRFAQPGTGADRAASAG